MSESPTWRMFKIPGDSKAGLATESESGRAPEETPVAPMARPAPEDILSMSTGSIGAQIDLLELQMSAIAAQNAALEEHLLPAREPASARRPPSSHEKEGVETQRDDDAVEEDRRRLRQECAALAEQLRRSERDAREELAQQARRFEEEGQRRVQQVQLLCEQLQLQVLSSEEEAQREARAKVEQARHEEARFRDESWELKLQLASSFEQLKCRELQAQLTARLGAAKPPPLAEQEAAPEPCAECEAARREARKWRHMIIEEQEKNSGLQERLLEALRAEREARRAEREARKAAGTLDSELHVRRYDSM